MDHNLDSDLYYVIWKSNVLSLSLSYSRHMGRMGLGVIQKDHRPGDLVAGAVLSQPNARRLEFTLPMKLMVENPSLPLCSLLMVARDPWLSQFLTVPSDLCLCVWPSPPLTAFSYKATSCVRPGLHLLWHGLLSTCYICNKRWEALMSGFPYICGGGRDIV